MSSTNWPDYFYSETFMQFCFCFLFSFPLLSQTFRTPHHSMRLLNSPLNLHSMVTPCNPTLGHCDSSSPTVIYKLPSCVSPMLKAELSLAEICEYRAGHKAV